MHTLLGLSSVLLVLLAGYLTLGLLRRLGPPGAHPSRRRRLQLLILAAPVASLGLGLAGLYHLTGRVCFTHRAPGAPVWDYTLGLALPLLMALVAVGALVLGLIRLLMMRRLVTRRGVPAGIEIQTLAEQLAGQLGASCPRVLICAYNRPLALTCGLWEPTVLLSTWMIDQLDRRELEAVVAHELAHVARRDYLVIWLATVLRDAFCYLPTSWAAYRQLQHEKEPVCDDLAVDLTRRPLAMASALAKVWRQAVDGPALATAQHLTGGGRHAGRPQSMAAGTVPGEGVEGRIERLLAMPGPTMVARSAHQPSRRVALGIGGVGFGGLLALQALTIVVLLAVMGCGPASRLTGFS